MSDASEQIHAAVDRDRLLRRRPAGAHRAAARRRRRATATRRSPRSSATPTALRSRFDEALLSTEYGPDGVQRRATLELWLDGEEGQPLRGAGTLISSSCGQPPGPRLRDRLLPLVARGPRGPRPLRGRAAPMAERIEAVDLRLRRRPDDAADRSRSWPSRTRPGSRPKRSARRCRRAPRPTARTRCSSSSAARSPRPPSSSSSPTRLEPLLGHRPEMHRFSEIYFEALHPNPPMIDADAGAEGRAATGWRC